MLPWLSRLSPSPPPPPPTASSAASSAATSAASSSAAASADDVRAADDAFSIVDLDGPRSSELRHRRFRALVELRASFAFRWPRSNEIAAALCGALDTALPLDISPLSAVTEASSAAATEASSFFASTDGGAIDIKSLSSASGAAVEHAMREHAVPAAADTGRPDSPEDNATSGPSPLLSPIARRDAAGTPTTPPPPPPPPPHRLPASVSAAALAADNAARLRALSQKETVHFHLSGSEALQAAARLVRVNTGRPIIVTFGGGNHGWADGVAAEGLALGEERYACNVLTLRERSALTIAVLQLRREEIAAVLVSPLQGIASPRKHGLGKTDCSPSADASYRAWLHDLRAACSRFGLPLIFDECATGFRVAPGGAQAYFGVVADVVCYGRILGGGLPLGAVCGPQRLLASSAPHLPLRAGSSGSCAGSGGAAEHVALMQSANDFLRSAAGGAPGSADAFELSHERASAWAARVNAALAAEVPGAPLRLQCEASIWTMGFTRAARHHFMLQLYLRRAGASLSWIGPGRLGFDPPHPSPAALDQLHEAIVAAARQMVDDGWWAAPGEVTVATEGAIRWRLLREAGASIGARLAAAARLLSGSRASTCSL